MLKESNGESDLQQYLHQFRKVVVVFEELETTFALAGRTAKYFPFLSIQSYVQSVLKDAGTYNACQGQIVGCGRLNYRLQKSFRFFLLLRPKIEKLALNRLYFSFTSNYKS